MVLLLEVSSTRIVIYFFLYVLQQTRLMCTLHRLHRGLIKVDEMRLVLVLFCRRRGSRCVEQIGHSVVLDPGQTRPSACRVSAGQKVNRLTDPLVECGKQVPVISDLAT
jgi:hypothetical protein